jgi:hypothetical protein
MAMLIGGIIWQTFVECRHSGVATCHIVALAKAGAEPRIQSCAGGKLANQPSALANSSGHCGIAFLLLNVGGPPKQTSRAPHVKEM